MKSKRPDQIHKFDAQRQFVVYKRSQHSEDIHILLFTRLEIKHLKINFPLGY